MKTYKATFDFSDSPQVLQILRELAVRKKTSQKQIVVDALGNYFSESSENSLILQAAEKSFSEWENDEDALYDKL